MNENGIEWTLITFYDNEVESDMIRQIYFMRMKKTITVAIVANVVVA